MQLNLVKLIPVALLGVSPLLLFGVSRLARSDSEDLRVLANQFRKVPNISYPSVDMLGHQINRFDELAVFPDCSSCSNFRIQCASLVKENKTVKFLILSPDKKVPEELLVSTNCQVAVFSKDSIYARLIPGLYNR